MSWRRYFRRKQWDRERALELEAYLEAETADNAARGMTPVEARRAAMKKLGNPTQIREEIYRMNSLNFIETLWKDLGYALRVLRKSPGFALVAICSLGLGIGANTAIFSVVRAVLLRSLPYPAPERLVLVGREGADAVTMFEYQFWKEHAAVFAGAAGWRGVSDVTLTYRGSVHPIAAGLATADFFRTLGVAPALGREFTSEETRPGGPRAIVLTDALWRSAFGGDPEVLGRAVAIDGASYNIVGVLPRGFWFPEAADAFVPLRFSGSMGDRGMNTVMIARLAGGVSLRQANAGCAALTAEFLSTKPEGLPAKYRGLRVTPYQDTLVGDVRVTLLLLLGAAGLLLLIACSNLAGLLLARLAARQREIALRLALGSGRGRLVRQILTENLVLTLAGGVAGVVLARWVLASFVAMIPFHLPASAPIVLDAPVLAFALGAAIATGVVFSLAPILSAARVDLQTALKAGGRSTAAASRQRARNVLVTAEVALSVTLLVSAGLLMQSLYRLHQEPLGFQPRGVITFLTQPPRGQKPADGWMFEALFERLRGLPGVRGVAAINQLPLVGHGNMPAQVAGQPEKSIGGMEIRVVTPGYFETMGIALRRGRRFTERDTAAAPPVILVNETVARKWWPSGDVLGGRVEVGRFRGKQYFDDPVRQVVGVVADTKTEELKVPPSPTVYLAVPQAEWYDQAMNWVVRVDSTAGMGARIRQAIAEVDPRQRVDRLRAMEEIVASNTRDSRFDAWLFGFFAALALVLTVVGVYGLLAFSVARRASEIGTRIALGASRASVVGLVLKQGIGLVAAGLLLGLAGALAVTRSLASLLFGVRPTDPLSFSAVAVLLLGAGAAASYFPARRAANVDPVVALREE